MLRSSRRPGILLGLLLAGVVATTAAAAAPGDPAGRTDLLQHEAELAARAGGALTELTTLERRLAAAETELASVRARKAAHTRRRAALAVRLRLARHNHGAAREALVERLRALYVEPAPQPLELVLSSSSLTEAVTTLDGLAAAAGLDRELVAGAASARTRLARVRRALAREGARLSRLEARAVSLAGALAHAREQRRAQLERVRTELLLTAGSLAKLESQARVTARAAAAAPSSAPSTAAPAPAAAPVGRSLTVVASGYALTGPTATGVPAGPGIVAVDPAVIPLGTRMTVPGYGEGVAADVGSAIRGASIDLWFPTTAEALRWGRRVVTISLHSSPGE